MAQLVSAGVLYTQGWGGRNPSGYKIMQILENNNRK